MGKLTAREERAQMDAENDALMDQLDSFSADVDTTINRLLNDDKTDGQVFLDVKDIYPNPDQPRKLFDEEKLQDLMENILLNGLVQSLAVMKQDNGYMLIDGERRWRAIKKACEMGLKSESFDPHSVPCYLKYHEAHKESQHLAVHSFVANEMAEKLSPVEKALSVHEMMVSKKYSFEELIDRTGMSQAMVSKHNVIGRWVVSTSLSEVLYSVDISFIDLYRLATCKERKAELPDNLKSFISGLECADSPEKKLHSWIISRCKKSTEKKRKNKESGVFGSKCEWEAAIARGVLTLKVKGVDAGKWDKIKQSMESVLGEDGEADV